MLWNEFQKQLETITKSYKLLVRVKIIFLKLRELLGNIEKVVLLPNIQIIVKYRNNQKLPILYSTIIVEQ